MANKFGFEIAWENLLQREANERRERAKAQAQTPTPKYVSYEDRLIAIDRKYKNSTERV